MLCDYGLCRICDQQALGGTAETQPSKGSSESALFAEIYHGIDKGSDNKHKYTDHMGLFISSIEVECETITKLTVYVLIMHL